MNASIKVLSILLTLSLFINPVWAFHTVHTDEVDFIIQPDDHDNVGYFNIVNGSSAYLHNTYGTNATELLGNVTVDTTTDIITSLAFLDNDLEDTSDGIEVYDEDVSFWTIYTAGSGSWAVPVITNEVTIITKGVNSTKMEFSQTGGFSEMAITHNYGSSQDWSGYDYINTYIYGSNSGVTLYFYLNTAPLPTGGYNYMRYDIVDNYVGWKRHVLPLATPDFSFGGIDLTNIDSVRFAPTTTGTWYIDRMVVDLGNWVGVEISIPDTLDGAIRNVALYAWDGSAYDATAFMKWDAENDSPAEQWDDSVLHFLDTSTIDNFYSGDIWDYMDSFLKGLRFTTKDTVHVSSSNVVVYSDLKGVAYRVGFAVKMPPDDGLDSASGGLSQFRFKADIYYDSNGETTVIHEGVADEASAGYGGSIGFIIASVIGFSVIIMGVTRKR